MIDYVHLSYHVAIPEHSFNQLMWKQWHINNEPYFIRSIRGIHLRYYPSKALFTIDGKLLALLHDTQVYNVDDIYGDDPDRFIFEVNSYLNRLLPHLDLDIRNFHVKRIDYCFNVKTEHVKTYLDFLNLAFKRCSNGKRINHVQEKNLNGSIYVKTKSDYEHNTRRNYVVNFYDKLNCLQKKKANGERVVEADFDRAQNVLRLEVQCGYQFIDQLCDELKIENYFGYLFDYNVALIAEAMIYTRVFRYGIEQDFFTYKAAKEILPVKSSAAKKALYSASTRQSICAIEYSYGRKVIKDAGIYPYCFLPKTCGVDYLPNPLKLIVQKLDSLGITL